jgi:CRISPR-associated protein Csx10
MLLNLNIEAQGPLAFAERRPNDQFRASQPYIPGSTIFGALGAILAREKQFDAEIFRELRCHNAYPAHEGDTWVHPLPLTALQPKGDEQANVTDALVARICWERQQPAALIYAPTDNKGRPWAAVGARFYTQHDDALHFRSVSQRVLTRVAINRRRRTAEDSRIYSPFVLNEARSTMIDGQRHLTPTRFVGTIALPDHADAIYNALQRIDALGARTSTGIGSVKIFPTSAQPDDGAAIAQRIDALTQRFRQQAKRYKDLGGEKWMVPERSIFTVNLLADALLLEHGWLPTQQLSPVALREAAGVEAEISLLRAFTVTKTVAGWHTTWQQPKPAQLAVGMGSVFVFKANEPLSDDDCARLAVLQHRGIGERRQEGYGQIRMCDTFHTRETWNLKEPV